MNFIDRVEGVKVWLQTLDGGWMYEVPTNRREREEREHHSHSSA